MKRTESLLIRSALALVAALVLALSALGAGPKTRQVRVTLTPAQAAQVKVIEEQYAAKRKAISEQMAKLRAEEAAAIDAVLRPAAAPARTAN